MKKMVVIALWTGEIFYQSHSSSLSKFANEIYRACNSEVVIDQAVFSKLLSSFPLNDFSFCANISCTCYQLPIRKYITNRIIRKLILQKGLIIAIIVSKNAIDFIY